MIAGLPVVRQFFIAVCITLLNASVLFAGELSAAVTPERKPDGARLEMQLSKKFDALYRRDSLQWVLDDLELRSGLRCAHPPTYTYNIQYGLGASNNYGGLYARGFSFSLESKDITVEDVLRKVVAANGAWLEFHGASAVIWKKAADATLEQLGRKAGDKDFRMRRAAVRELATLADPRIYPLIWARLTDEEPEVSAAARSALGAHAQVLNFVEWPPAAVNTLLELWKHSEHGATGRGEELTLISLLAATHDHLADDALLELLKTGTPLSGTRAAAALSEAPDPYLTDKLLVLAADGTPLSGGADLQQAQDTPEQWREWEKEHRPRIQDLAALALAHNPDPRASEAILRVVQKPSPFLEPYIQSLQAACLGRGELAEPAAEKLLGVLERANADSGNSADAALAASQTLAHLRDDHVVAALVTQLKSAGWRLQLAVGTLKALADPRAVEALIPLLKCDNNRTNFIADDALRALARIEDSKAQAAVEARLKDPETRRSAALALACDPGCAEPLRKLMQKNPDPLVRATFAMACSRDPYWTEELAALVHDPDPSVRSTAICSLGRIADPAAMAVLKPLLHGPDTQVRALAVDALTLGQSPEAVDAQIDALKDSAQDVRVAAVCGLDRIVGTTRQRLATRGAQLYWDGVENCVQQTYGRGGVPAARIYASLIPMLKDSDPVVRLLAIVAVGGGIHRIQKKDEPDLWARAISGLNDIVAHEPAAELRRQAVRLMESIHDSDVAAAVKPMLNSPDESMRANAIFGLCRGNPKAGAVALRDCSPKVRALVFDLIGAQTAVWRYFLEDISKNGDAQSVELATRLLQNASKHPANQN